MRGCFREGSRPRWSIFLTSHFSYCHLGGGRWQLGGTANGHCPPAGLFTESAQAVAAAQRCQGPNLMEKMPKRMPEEGKGRKEGSPTWYPSPPAEIWALLGPTLGQCHGVPVARYAGSGPRELRPSPPPHLPLLSPQISSPRCRAAWWGAVTRAKAPWKCARASSGARSATVPGPRARHGGRRCAGSSSAATSASTRGWTPARRPWGASTVPWGYCPSATSFWRKGHTARGCLSHVSWPWSVVGRGRFWIFVLRLSQ